jgi:hypothetical protein
MSETGHKIMYRVGGKKPIYDIGGDGKGFGKAPSIFSDRRT